MSEPDRGKGERESGSRQTAHDGDDRGDPVLRDAVEGCAHDATVERGTPGRRGLALGRAVCYGFGISRRPAGVFAVSTSASSQARSSAGRSPA